ncbi:hypothetical protein ACIRQY_07355 [Streptomyces sp. NPDC101490]|uniref:hypothetical protein n=1 Tax=unclassified Streptomyces TaxID=2593676 RepID=UPI0033179EA5
MTATTFTLVTTVPRLRRTAAALRAIRAFGGAVAGVALLGDYGPPGAAVRNPHLTHTGPGRPGHGPAPD